MKASAAKSILFRFAEQVAARRAVRYRRALFGRVLHAAVTIQSFARMAIVRAKYQRTLSEGRFTRHNDILSSYLSTMAIAAISSFLPQRQQKEKFETTVRHLMLHGHLTYAEAKNEAISRGEFSGNVLANARPSREEMYGHYCNSRSVPSAHDTSDSDDDSIDEALLAKNRPGRLYM